MKATPRLALTASTLALVLTACGADASDTGADSESATLGHVHGLALDPSDERLYVATHHGLFTTGESGDPVRVGDRADDFMGFTVAGPKRFLASGHPAPGSGEPAHHGLIESTDAGKTWKTLSLGGEADFHALEHTHNTTYGYDSTKGMLRVSKDGRSWDDRARLQALDLAVSPNDPDTVLATTPDGVARSTDGGRTFGTGREPALAFVSWPASGALYGLDSRGGVHRSTDGGATWRRTGEVPGAAPGVQALTAVDKRHVLAATADGVYESTDGGRAFTKLFDINTGAGH
ncbi:exo-alpha-sialidase [Streptomyces durbertensis]|uniref:Exo-alpha-sialidase n=1 Tax=Streptomyces durbertensis TaxID=2448886 RepID=A0ABR6EG84_9ACTN|nr:sialidase family protein [Streptomyces durbertensis]MBB1244097.1 exo-alpha-sialidase [Streptomyces durbertensis]